MQDEDEFANGGVGDLPLLSTPPLYSRHQQPIFRRSSMADSVQSRVLILSKASAGAGHVRAADALLADFKRHPAVANGGQVEHWDMLKYTTAVFRTIYSKVYLDLVNRAPWFLGMVYKATDKPWKQTAAQAFEKFNAGPFIKALAGVPAGCGGLHALYAAEYHFVAEYEKEDVAEVDAKAIVVTDLDLHAMWLTRSYSRYFVALEETRIYLERMGIPRGKGDGERDTGGSGVSD